MNPEEKSPPEVGPVEETPGERPPPLEGDPSRVRLWQGSGGRSSGEQDAPKKRSTLLRLKQLTEERLKRLSGVFSRPPEPSPSSDSGERERVRLWQPKPETSGRPPSRTTLARLKQLTEERLRRVTGQFEKVTPDGPEPPAMAFPGLPPDQAGQEPRVEPPGAEAHPETEPPKTGGLGGELAVGGGVGEATAAEARKTGEAIAAEERKTGEATAAEPRVWQGQLKTPVEDRGPDRIRRRLQAGPPPKRSTLAELKKRATFELVKLSQSMPQLSSEAPLGGPSGFVTDEDFPQHPTIQSERPEEAPPKKYRAPSMLLRTVEEASRELETEEKVETPAPEIPAPPPPPPPPPRRSEGPVEPPPPSIVVPRVSLEELTTFTRQFAVMLEAGVQVHEVLHFLSESEEATLAPVLGEVARRVDTGSTLSWAMQAFPTVFSEIYVGMVRIGEASGGLSDVLQKLADLMEKQVRLQKKIISSLAYPIILATVGTLGTLAFIYWVVPIMLTLFESVNHPLPLATRILVSFRHWLPFLASLLVISGVSLWLARPYLRRYLQNNPLLLITLHGLPLTLPQIGPLMSKVVTARMMFAMATLLDTGLSVVPALVNASSVVGNRWIASRVELAQRDIMEGSTVSEALGRHGVIPDNAVYMLSVGEESARLPDMVRRVAMFYEEEVDLVLMTLSSLLEPAIMLVMGLVVGFVAFAAISPTVQLLNVL